MIADPATPNEIFWTVFANVLTVNREDDDFVSGDTCTSASCRLRTAIEQANSGTLTPVLIQFDHELFPTIRIKVTRSDPLRLQSAGMVIDGTGGAGAMGDPSPLAPFTERLYNTIIELDPTPKNVEDGGNLRVQAEGVQLVGLDIFRTLGIDTDLVGLDQNIVAFDPTSRNSSVHTCRLNGGAAGRTDANGVERGTAIAATGKDCIDAENTGATAATPIVVDNSEIRYCYDRGAKSQAGYLSLTNNWIHNNLRGGIFAQRPDSGAIKGEIRAVGNLLEQNGKNCPQANGNPDFAGDPTACGAQSVARLDASEMQVEAGTTTARASIETDGNIARDGVMAGIFLEDRAQAVVKNDYLCGMLEKGIWIRNGNGTDPIITVRGIAAVYNADGGAVTDMAVAPDFGRSQPGAAGGNAFARNGSPLGNNFRNAAPTPRPLVPAWGNQWQSCYLNESSENLCNKVSIASQDIKNGENVFYQSSATNECDPQTGCFPQRSEVDVLDTAIEGIAPHKGIQGAPIEIRGRGFNAIDGHVGTNSTGCRNLATSNKCAPLQGTCVQFQDAHAGWVDALDVLAVTPNYIVVTMPFTCSKPTKVRVRRLAPVGQLPVLIETGQIFCRNS